MTNFEIKALIEDYHDTQNDITQAITNGRGNLEDIFFGRNSELSRLDNKLQGIIQDLGHHNIKATECGHLYTPYFGRDQFDIWNKIGQDLVKGGYHRIDIRMFDKIRYDELKMRLKNNYDIPVAGKQVGDDVIIYRSDITHFNF